MITNDKKPKNASFYDLYKRKNDYTPPVIQQSSVNIVSFVFSPAAGLLMVMHNYEVALPNQSKPPFVKFLLLGMPFVCATVYIVLLLLTRSPLATVLAFLAWCISMSLLVVRWNNEFFEIANEEYSEMGKAGFGTLIKLVLMGGFLSYVIRAIGGLIALPIVMFIVGVFSPQ